MPRRRRWRLIRQVSNAVIAACAAAVVMVACAAGLGRLPALGPLLDPGHGVWTSAAGGGLPSAQVLTLPGLGGPVTVSFDGHGIAAIGALDQADAMLALGYLHARFRLAQMDLLRRTAEGRLAALAGPSALASDVFELRLGLLRTARREWARLPKSGAAATMLTAYASGVNDYLSQARAAGQWPAQFSLARVYPAGWTPVDSLAVQGMLAQELDFGTAPLDDALLYATFGARQASAWFPALLPGSKQRSGSVEAGAGPAARAAAAVLSAVRTLPSGQIPDYSPGSAWAVNGPRVRGGGAMLAGDPRLAQTLPSEWFAVTMTVPGLDVTGASFPGLPGVLLGSNQHLAWSIAGAQGQSALFYLEKTSSSRPGRYFWRGRWRAMRQVRYAIDVAGGRVHHLTVDLTVHGPVLTPAGQVMSVTWTGNEVSPDVAVLLKIAAASDFAQFKAALAGWRAPLLDFVYADEHGNIGAVGAGDLPVVRHGSPWLPMPGTGQSDVTGVGPSAAAPQSYDPPGHLIVAPGQRPGAASYDAGTAGGGTSAGLQAGPEFQAGRVYPVLASSSDLTPSASAALQTSLTDALAVRVLPVLRAALRNAALPDAASGHAARGNAPGGYAALTPIQQQAAALLRRWNRSMGQRSAAATIWWTVWSDYVAATFGPWWKAAGFPAGLDRAGLVVSAGQLGLAQALEHWTLADPSNPVFTAPGGPARTATSVLRAAFVGAVADLHARLGGSPATWAWGKVHHTLFRSLTRASALGYGPLPADGDPWTADAADGFPVASIGPSWRMIVRWPGRGTGFAEVSYPGGQSENPASPWYANLITGFRNGAYVRLPSPGAAAVAHPRWELMP